MRAGTAIAALLVVPLLAGCTEGDDAPDPVAGLAPGELRAGGFYSFAHAGGPLLFTLGEEGDASFDLFDGADRRLGNVGFSSGPGGSSVHSIEGVGPGDVVLHVTTINGTLRVESDGRAVASFRPLGVLVERHVLVDLPPAFDPLQGFGVAVTGVAEPFDETMAVALRRAPTDLRVLATGPSSDLRVEARSSKGVVLTASGDDVGPSPLGGSPGLHALPGVLTPQNIRDGGLTVRVSAADLAGAVVLESHSYSRASLPAPQRPGPDPAAVAFRYGALPGAPVAFLVHPDASVLVLWQEDPAAGNASVAVFGPDDQRVATVLVPHSGSVEVEVAGGGEYVAVLLEGEATLGADATPSDFGLRPLDSTTSVLPASAAGTAGSLEGDRYGQGMEEATFETAYALRGNLSVASGGNEVGPGQPIPLCGGGSRGRYLRVDQGGESVLAYLEATVTFQEPFDQRPFVAGSRALTAGALQVHHDGFGDDGCGRPVVEVLSYVRP